jgi:hypothetical protein
MKYIMEQIKSQVEKATALAIDEWQLGKTTLALWNFENGMRTHLD